MKVRAVHLDESEIHTDLNELIEKLLKTAEKTLQFFDDKLDTNGSYGKEAQDLSCYYKSPMMFIAAGQPDRARKLLSHIQATYMREDGDFTTLPNVKSVKPEYTTFWSYINGWLIRAANHLHMSELVEPAYHYFKQFYVKEDGRFLASQPDVLTASTDTLTLAHHGLVHLEMNNMKLAISAGNYLCDVLNVQPDLANGFYLNFDQAGQPVTSEDALASPFGYLNKHEPNQMYFMMGYPAAFLVMLYKHTGEEKYLEAARYYVDYTLTCDSSIFHSLFSHKIAWAAGLLYRETEDEIYLRALEAIVEHIIDTQSSSGIWYADADVNTAFDQSAEIACWLLTIAQDLKAKV